MDFKDFKVFMIYAPNGKIIAKVRHPSPTVGVFVQTLRGHWENKVSKGGTKFQAFQLDEDSYFERMGTVIYLDTGSFIAEQF